ncbi:MAG: mandelate racemase/muconate lactonizing enzyme family protein [Halobacteriales archaeon]|nr:mandelate racemase/muconate lactonizing enzyme family protein [Halobacteriales archaeon]
MEITDVETHLVGRDVGHAVDRWLYVSIRTDEGITGIGESGAWGFLPASKAAIESVRDYLIGKDPLRRDHHYQYLYRNAHFRGAAVMGALSALDIALWDIAGKYYDAPVYELLGGACRDKARVYVHAFGETTDELVEECVAAKDQGFTAVGHLSPLLDEPRSTPYFETHAQLVGGAAERVRRYREAVGDAVDLCIEIHRRLEPDQAIALGRAIEEYHPMFYEDPVRPDSFDAMAQVAGKVGIPIATGERIHTVQEFEMLLARDAVQYVRPDIALAGGLTGAKKVAALAEARHVGVVPHNPLSPVTTAASLQLAASIPNFAIQEYPFRPGRGEAPGHELVNETFDRDGGFLAIPDRPGIGVTLDEGAIADAEEAYVPPAFETRLHEDGSVVDQ